MLQQETQGVRPTHRRSLGPLPVILIAVASVVLLAIGISWAVKLSHNARERERQERQASTIAKIRDGHGNATVHIHDADFVAQISRDSECASKISTVNVWTDDLADVRWAYLRDFPEVRTVAVYNSPDVDRLLAQIQGAMTIEDLSLVTTDVTDEGMSYVNSLPRLKRLHLGSAYHHPSPKTLKCHPSIETLWLEGFAEQEIVGEWLDVLPTMPKLRELNLRGSPVGDQTMRALEGALPHCQVDR